MNEMTPSEKLQAPRHPWRIAGIVAGGIAAVVVAVLIVGFALTPHPPRLSTASSVEKSVIDHKLMVAHQLKSTVPPPPPEPVYVAPPAAPEPSYSYGNYPSGWTVPNRPDGSPDTSACASSSASFVGGTIVCD